jgi:hypothetical protein
MNVTTQSMRYFAADCLTWARDADDASKRQMIVSAAREWAKTADAIDRVIESGKGNVLPDLRSKLN